MEPGRWSAGSAMASFVQIRIALTLSVLTAHLAVPPVAGQAQNSGRWMRKDDRTGETKSVQVGEQPTRIDARGSVVKIVESDHDQQTQSEQGPTAKHPARELPLPIAPPKRPVPTAPSPPPVDEPIVAQPRTDPIQPAPWPSVPQPVLVPD